jgi:hypothetical protein
VLVLENVEGPDPLKPENIDGRAVRTKRPDRVEFLVTASRGMISSAVVPQGRRVRVEGFEFGWGTANVFDSARGFYMPASAMPGTRPTTGPSSQRSAIERFPMIKVKRLYELLPDGKEQLVWETSESIDGL